MAKTKGIKKIYSEGGKYYIYELSKDFVNSALDKNYFNNKQIKYTVDEIKTLLKTNDEFVIRSLLRLYAYQTEDEKQTQDSHLLNGVGFNSFDANSFDKIIKSIIGDYKITESAVYNIRKKIMKYAKQITNIVNN